MGGFKKFKRAGGEPDCWTAEEKWHDASARTLEEAKLKAAPIVKLLERIGNLHPDKVPLGRRKYYHRRFFYHFSTGDRIKTPDAVGDELDWIIKYDHDDQVYRIKCDVYFEPDGFFWYEDTYEEPIRAVDCSIVVGFYSQKSGPDSCFRSIA